MTASIKEFFTEAEWDAIYEAMADYQDHGEQETITAHSVQSKISSLFQDWYTKRGWCIPLKTHQHSIAFFIMINPFTSSAMTALSVSDSNVVITRNNGKDYTYGIADVQTFATAFNAASSKGRFVAQQIKASVLTLIDAWSSLEV